MIGEVLHVAEPSSGDPFPGLVEHLLGKVDADDAAAVRIVRQRQARADADLQDAPADALARRDHRAPPALEHRAEHEIVNRAPSARRLFPPLVC